MSPDLCPPKDHAASGPLLSSRQAGDLERLFEVLASGTRLRLLHALSVLDDPCMGDLAEAVGMKPQAVSNQLRRLVDMGILETRRHGNHVHYGIADPCAAKLLHYGLCLNEERQKRAGSSAP